MARDSGPNEWDILKFIAKLISGLALFAWLKGKSKKAEEKLRSQFLLGVVYDEIAKRTQEEVGRNENWHFKFLWKIFKGMTPGRAAFASAFTTYFALWILFSILGLSRYSILNIGNLIGAFYTFFAYRPIFAKYKAFQPADALAGDAESLGLSNPGGKPTKKFLASYDPKKELMLGQRTKMPLTQRKTHMYVAGRSGWGKSRAGEWWVLQDIFEGRGCAVIDPHGDLIENCLASIAHRLHEEGVALDKLTNHPLMKRLKIIDPTDPEWAVGFNPLQKTKGIDTYTQAKQLEDSFKKVWRFDENEAPVMSQVLRNTAYVLIENNQTLLDATLLLTTDRYRRQMLGKITHPEVRLFWEERFENWIRERQTSKIDSAYNKIEAFTSNDLIRPMIGQQKSTIKLREAMDNEEILLIKLPKGRLGSASNLLGAFFVASLHLAAMTRVDIAKEEDRKPFYVYVDEFQNFASANFDEILREDRKYGVHYILINQDLGGVDEDVIRALFSNVNVFLSFQLGAEEDAIMIASKFFKLTGKMVRDVDKQMQVMPGVPLPISHDKLDYHSVSDEMRLRAEEFRMLPKRVFAVNYHGLKKPLVDTTVTIDRPNVDEEPVKSYIKKIKEIVNRRNAGKKDEIIKKISEKRSKFLRSADHSKGWKHDKQKQKKTAKAHPRQASKTGKNRKA